MKKSKPTREERLAAALRENLKRRKARAKAHNNARAAPKEADRAPLPAEGEGTEAPSSRHQSATKRV